MRILFVINAMGRGGAEIQVMDLAIELTARGHVVAVAVLLPFEDFEDTLRRAGVGTFTLGLRKGAVSPRAQLELFAYARRFAPDVIHGHMFAGNVAAPTTGALLAPFSRPVVVCTAHTPTETSRRYMAYRATDFLCDGFTFVSREGKDNPESSRALRRGKGVVVANGIDLERFVPATEEARRKARESLGLGDDFTWLAIGSFRDEQKDFSNLLRAFAKLASDSRPTRLLIAGEGKLLEDKRALVRQLNIEDKVAFLGLRSDVPDLMAASDAYVMSSAWEGLPIVLLEAAASGLPMVVTDVGGNRDVALGDCGVVVPAKDSTKLSTAMREVMDRPETSRAAMGQQARRHAVSSFSIGQIVSTWEALYGTLKDRRGYRAGID